MVVSTAVDRALQNSCLLASLFAALCAPTYALDRITLRNGFTYDCARQQAVDDAHTRLFLSPNADAGYVDVATIEIVAVDPLPSPPPTQRDAATAPVPPPFDVPTLLASAGTAHNIDRELLASIVHAESSGRVHAVSRTGAQGLMQLMPLTAQSVGVADSFQPDQNINGGATYLDTLLTRYHDNLALALAAYNAGPAAVVRYGGVPPFRETQAYVARVMSEFKRRKQALAGAGNRSILQAAR